MWSQMKDGLVREQRGEIQGRPALSLRCVFSGTAVPGESRRSLKPLLESPESFGYRKKSFLVCWRTFFLPQLQSKTVILKPPIGR